MIVDLDLGVGPEVVGQQHHRNIDVAQLVDLFANQNQTTVRSQSTPQITIKQYKKKTNIITAIKHH